jgi:short-subunit dehydrogenase
MIPHYTQPSPSARVVMITGAGSGIGLALAKIFWHKPEFRVIASARPLALKELSSKGFYDTDRFLLRPLDVISSNSRKVLLKEIEALWGGVDVLINNAGISFRSSIEDMDLSEEELQMATNYFGPIGLIREVLPGMRSKRAGQIVNVSSVGGMMAMPTMGSYSASKFALEGASEALWYELKPWGISVSLVQPGFVNSVSHKKVYKSNKARSLSDYGEYYKNMSSFIEKLLN